MKKIFPMIVFSCMTAVVLLICIYRSLQQEDAAGGTPEIADAVLGAENMQKDAAWEAAMTADVTPGMALTTGAAAEETDMTVAADATPETDMTVAEDATPETEAVAAWEKETTWETEAEWDEIKRVALTFDDGPHPVYTVKLLNGLAERGVQATFFVIGENIPGNEEIIARMDQEGHLIGNHTYDHVKITDLSVEAACEQVERTSALVKEITGKDTEYVRPPFGSWRKDLECSFEMILVLWDVDPLDWTTCNVSDVVRRVLEAVGPDDIILLHDYYESSVDAALLIVDALMEQGYVFVTVDELILE
ncbi:MAG: polysaccharide deacetylase family protein [Lachnospiraceae bacterium]|nr:polysaccharide deacetylase family protein [Lachnospiraceae bacterium]